MASALAGDGLPDGMRQAAIRLQATERVLSVAFEPVDEVTLEYVKGRPFAPKGPEWDQAAAYWRTRRPRVSGRTRAARPRQAGSRVTAMNIENSTTIAATRVAAVRCTRRVVRRLGGWKR